MNNLLNKKRSPFAYLITCTLLTFVYGCGSSEPDEVVDPVVGPITTLDDGTKLVGLPKSSSRSLFTGENTASSEQYIRNYLIKEYGQASNYRTYDTGEVTEAVSAPLEASSDASESITSTTNTVENNVDEADLIKTFSENGQDYLVTITQPKSAYFYGYDDVSLDEYKNQKTAATLNLYNIDTSPTANLLVNLPLNEDAYHVSGIYTYQNNAVSIENSIDASTQLIAQTSLSQSPSDWNAYQSWSYGRTGIESIELSNEAMNNAWSVVFDGHMLDSRRIENHVYVAMRHYTHVENLEYVYANHESADTIIANNLAIIEQLDIEAMLPQVTLTQNSVSETSTAFELESCQLPSNEDRFSNGSIMFNFIAKVNLDTGNIDNVQCVLSEITQLYMNEKSLFLIDANQWSDQTSRLHRFTLDNLSYDTSLTVEGTLGWRSAEFRIKELDDGTVVLVTSKPEYANDDVNEDWCCWFNNNWIHKLQLFQKDENLDYQKIAELPNETQPDNDATPQSLGKAGEDIFGVRITESSVQVVTFQQTDPLYIFDISDRKNPTFTGELADSGFSSYLHTYDDLIVGIGFDANEWGQRQGLKVELYTPDSNQESGISSLDEYTFGSSAETPVDWDHHAYTTLDINDNETRIAIPATIYTDYQWDYTGLLLFTLNKSEASLTFDGTIKGETADYWYGSSSWSDRSVIQHSEQGSVVHYIHLGEVQSSLWTSAE